VAQAPAGVTEKSATGFRADPKAELDYDSPEQANYTLHTIECVASVIPSAPAVDYGAGRHLRGVAGVPVERRGRQLVPVQKDGARSGAGMHRHFRRPLVVENGRTREMTFSGSGPGNGQDGRFRANAIWSCAQPAVNVFEVAACASLVAVRM